MRVLLMSYIRRERETGEERGKRREERGEWK